MPSNEVREINTFDERIQRATGRPLEARSIRTVQANLGFRCNLACAHCHVAASPHRKETMSQDVMDRIVEVARAADCELVDLTGGAPEFHPLFREFVAKLRAEGFPVQVRTNLAILLDEGMEDLPVFFREMDIRLVASLPGYLEEDVSVQRGEGVHERSVEAIRRLNALGYGTGDGLRLSLVFNPGGPFLPPPQKDLERDYRRELDRRFKITFTDLITITNMPVGRFRQSLERENREGEYLHLLRSAFNPETVENLMCRDQISVGWDGTLYDCDFNLALKLPVDHGAPDQIAQFHTDTLANRRIVTRTHCFGCTAASGSS